MKTMQWTTVDKSEWGPGPWQGEPDKKQWQDPETGLPCLIVRGPMGALCGYVGVLPGHPLHGKDYSQEETFPCTDCGDDYHYSCKPQAHLSVHGGVTFSNSCAPMGHEVWEKAKKNFAAAKKDADKYPDGDAARYRERLAPVIEDYDAWRAHVQGTSVCHIAAPGETDDVWWFGFDCAHAFDMVPGMRRYHHLEDEAYRDIDYVADEATSLAKQLAALA